MSKNNYRSTKSALVIIDVQVNVVKDAYPVISMERPASGVRIQR